MKNPKWIALVFLFVSSFSWAQGNDPDVEFWSSNVDAKTLKDFKLNKKIYDALFKAVDDIKLFKVDLGDGKVDFKIKRRVMDNEDGTWTVIDRFFVQGNIPLLNDTLSTFGSAGTMGIRIGTRAGIEFLNVRQVTPEGYSSLPSADERRTEIESTAWYPQLREFAEEDQDPEGQWVYTGAGSEKRKISFLPKDPDNKVKFSKFWNLILFPFRLPLRADSVYKLEDGEIISYAATGFLEVGPTVGWNIDPTGLTHFVQGDVTFTTYLSGTYRITVLKENDRFVKVKVTKIKDHGLQGGIGGTQNNDFSLGGFWVFKDLDYDLKFSPFQTKLRISDIDTFDVGYRYDLHNQNGREAYEQAVKGMFAQSEELSISKDGKPHDHTVTGVQKLLIKDKHNDQKWLNRRMRLSFLYKSNSAATHSDIKVKITNPGTGEENFFTSLSETTDEWKVLWGAFEKLRFGFAVHVDLDEYEANPQSDDATFFVAEGEIHDSSTKREEMMNYILGVENSVGKYGIFPRPPKGTDPQGTFGFLIPSGLKNGLGKSRFQFQFVLNNSQLDRLIDYDKNQMWRALEKAFGVREGAWSSSFSRTIYTLFRSPLTILNVPLYIADLNIRQGSILWHARQIRRKWLRIRKKKDPIERASTLGKMFFENMYSWELVKLLRHVYENERASYIASGYSSIFGRIKSQGETKIYFADLASEQQKKIDNPPKGVSTAHLVPNVRDVEVKKLTDDKFELKFFCDNPPKAIYLEVIEKSGFLFFKKDRTAIDLLVFNTGSIVAGVNTVILDAGDDASPWSPLAKRLKKGGDIKFSLAANSSGVNWDKANVVKVK